jgi:hypothetical protein
VISKANKVIIEKHEHFVKQTFRNRTHILTTQGVERLIVPLQHETGKQGKAIISEIRIDYSQKWLNNHWRAIESAYRKAAFFEYYCDDLHQILFRKYSYLYDLNFEFLTICLKWLKLSIPIQESMAYEKTMPEGTFDYRNVINPKNPELSAPLITPVEYTQVFGNKFVKNMSIIDLVFCDNVISRAVMNKIPAACV